MPDDDATDDLLAETVSGIRAGLRTTQRWARVRVVHPAELVTTLEVRGLESLVLGRNPEEEKGRRIAHRTVSRKHLRIEWDPGARGYVARDLGSRNGSWIDGAQAGDRARLIGNGAVLRLGDVLGVFETGDTKLADDPAVSRDAVPGDSAGAALLRKAIGAAAPDPSPVLIVGETGTGKELTGAEVHRLSGRPGPLVTLNCAELSPTVIESQLFGHEKGAFTGATGASQGLFRAAHTGSLFLDEIGELPLELQPKLLRVIQTGEVLAVGGNRKAHTDVRMIAATNRDLAHEVRSGTFRRDLYARMSLWEIRVPSVRERRCDILGWLNILHSAWLAGRGREAPPLALEPDVAEALLLHPWPENLRGLDRLVHALASDPATGGQVMLHQLPAWLELGTAQPNDDLAPEPSPRTVESKPTGEAQRRLPTPTKEELVAVLEEHDWVVRAVAKHFGRDRRQVYRWLENFGIRRDE